jgi:hypothetical protein
MKNNRFFLVLISTFLGITYIFSGATKGADIGSFVNLLLNYGSTWFAYFAPFTTGFEIFLGFGLLLGAFRKRLAQISFFFLVVLSAVYLVGYLFKGIQDCGCFGDVLELSPSLTLFKNGLMLFASWWLWQNSTQEVNGKWLIVISIIFGLITSTINGIEFRGRINNDLHLQGLNLKNTFLKPYLQNGEQTILIFNPNCKPCRKTSIALKRSKKPVIGICANGFLATDLASYQKNVQPNFPIRFVRLDSIQKHFFEVPSVLKVKNGVVQEVSHHEN